MIKTELKETIVQTGIKMLKDGLTVGTWGNFSLRDPETGLIYITPSGMDYETLKTTDVVVLDSEINIVDGECTPSVEKGMHIAIYNAREDVNAVVHTHPLYSTVLGVNKMELPAISEDFAQIVGYKMSCSEYASRAQTCLPKMLSKVWVKKTACCSPIMARCSLAQI